MKTSVEVLYSNQLPKLVKLKQFFFQEIFLDLQGKRAQSRLLKS